MYKFLTVILIISGLAGLILPNFSFAQVSSGESIKLPGNLEEIKDAGLKALGFIPEFLKRIWDGFSGFCLKVWNFLKNIWNSYIFPFFDNLWQKTLGKEIRERKPVIEEEFKKEKKEMKEEIKAGLPNTLKSLWERFKELIK